MTSIPPPGGDSSGGSWSYKASGKPIDPPPPGHEPEPAPRARRLSLPGSAADLDPLSRRLLSVASGLSVLLIVLVVFAWLHGSDEASLNPVAAAAARTQQQPGSRIAIGGSYSLPNGQAMAMHGHGVYDGVTGRSRSVIEVAAPAPVGSVRVEGVGDKHVIYMRSKLFSAGLPPGDKWMAIQPGLGGAGQTAMTGDTGSESQLQLLRATSGDVEDLGEAEVRGVETTRYSGMIDLHRYAEHLADAGKATAAHEYEQLAKAMPVPSPVEAWLDDAGLVRRMRIVMELPSESGPRVKMDMTMTFFDFGTAPKITLPDRDEAFDATPISRAKLGLLDGSAVGIPATADSGPALTAAAFRKKTKVLCGKLVARARRLAASSPPLQARLHTAEQRAGREGGSSGEVLHALRAYSLHVLEPANQLGLHLMRGVAKLSPPPDSRAAFERFLHFGAVSAEVEIAQTRALELGSTSTVKELNPQQKTASRRAREAGREAGMGVACTTSDGN